MDQSTVSLIVFLVLIIVMFYFLIIRPQQRRQQEHDKLLSSLGPGDKVITIGGIFGEIDSLSEDSVVLRTEDGGLLRVARNGIAAKRE